MEQPVIAKIQKLVPQIPNVKLKMTKGKKRLLGVQAYLKDGLYDNVFELSYSNGNEQWHCRICEIRIPDNVFSHERGRKHIRAVAAGAKNAKKLASKPNKEIHAPGESVSPEKITITQSTDHEPPLEASLQHWWYCQVCKVPYKGAVAVHESSMEHMKNVFNYNKELNDGKLSEKENEQPPVDVPNVQTGSQGAEGGIVKVAKIQKLLDAHQTSALLGLEYLLEIQDNDDNKEPSYQCLLCGQRGDSQKVLLHLMRYDHIQRYLRRHFPKTYQALVPLITRQFKRCWQRTLNQIARAIETKYGRLFPHPVELDTFNDRKEELYQTVQSGPHFSEDNGVTFEYLVHRNFAKHTEGIGDLLDTKTCLGFLISAGTVNELKALNSFPTEMEEIHKHVPKVETKNLSVCPPPDREAKKPRLDGIIECKDSSSVSSPSRSDLSDFGNKKTPPIDPRQAERQRSRSPIVDRHRCKTKTPSPQRQRDHVQHLKELTNNHKDDEVDEFRKHTTAIETAMEKTLQHYKANPSEHPHYNQEWKLFWSRRYKELQAEGKDVSKYDFNPEWFEYWNQKMEEFHKEDVKDKIETLKRRLGMCVSERTPVSFKIGNNTRPADARVTPTSANVDNIRDSYDSPSRSGSSWEMEPYNDYYSNRSRGWDSEDEDSWQRDTGYDSRKDYYKSPSAMRDYPESQESDDDDDDDGDVNIIDVLRLLTTLKDKLGSFGPKVIDMLEKALKMENEEPCSSETLLDKEINFVLFEMVKERLKRALHAGLVSQHLEITYEIAISKIVSLLHLASIRSNAKRKPSDVRKAAIVNQIATALVQQGKTDVSRAELDKLINAVVGMTKTSKTSDTPVTTTTFQQGVVNKPPKQLKPVFDPAIVQSTTSTLLKTTTFQQTMADKPREEVTTVSEAAVIHTTTTTQLETTTFQQTMSNKPPVLNNPTTSTQLETTTFQQTMSNKLPAVNNPTTSTQLETTTFHQTMSNKPPAVNNPTTSTQLETTTFQQTMANKSVEEVKSKYEPVVVQPTMSTLLKTTSQQTMTNKPLEEVSPVSEPTTSTILETTTLQQTMANTPREVVYEPIPEIAIASLSGFDLQILMNNFKHLSPVEQHGLMNYLEKVETKEPERYKKLRKFIHLHRLEDPMKDKLKQNPTSSENIFDLTDESLSVISIESDDSGDCRIVDIYKEGNKNVKKRRKGKEPKVAEDPTIILTKLRAVIANIMVSVASNSSSPSITEAAPNSHLSNIPPVSQNNLQSQFLQLQPLFQSQPPPQFQLQAQLQSQLPPQFQHQLQAQLPPQLQPQPQPQFQLQSQAQSQPQPQHHFQPQPQSQLQPLLQPQLRPPLPFPPIQNLLRPQIGFPPQNLRIPFNPLFNNPMFPNNMQLPRMPLNLPQMGGFNSPMVPNMNNMFNGNFGLQPRMNLPTAFSPFSPNPLGPFNNNWGAAGNFHNGPFL